MKKDAKARQTLWKYRKCGPYDVRYIQILFESFDSIK